MSTAIYSRVSTAGQNYEAQEGEVLGFAKRAGYEEIEYYRDTISGVTKNRPELDRLLKDCRAGKVDRILCYKMDRLGRSVINSIQTLKELNELNVPIYFTSQGFNTEKSNPTSQLFINIISCFAEWERETIRERIKAGIEARKAKGLKVGGKVMPVGVEDKIKALRLSGMSLKPIAHELKVSVGYVWNVLNKPLTPKEVALRTKAKLEANINKNK